MPKLRNSNETFWVIFKHCESFPRIHFWHPDLLRKYFEPSSKNKLFDNLNPLNLERKLFCAKKVEMTFLVFSGKELRFFQFHQKVSCMRKWSLGSAFCRTSTKTHSSSERSKDRPWEYGCNLVVALLWPLFLIIVCSTSMSWLFTSAPSCLAGQLVIAKDPLIKSFCTSITKKAETGRTIFLIQLFQQ